MIENVYALVLSQHQKHRQFVEEATTFRLVATLRQGRQPRPSLVATLVATMLGGFGNVR